MICPFCKVSVDDFAVRCPHCTSDISVYAEKNAKDFEGNLKIGLVIAVLVAAYAFDFIGPLFALLILAVAAFIAYKIYKIVAFIYAYIIQRKKIKEETSAILRDQPKKIIKCTNCQKRIRVPRMKTLQIKCPHCKHVWHEET